MSNTKRFRRPSRTIYSDRVINGEDFILAEKLDDYRTAQLAAAEYRAEGWLCRVEPVDSPRNPHYRIWVGRERKIKVRTLKHEKIRRRKSSRILAAS